jgi:hypothetical protein
MLITIQHVMQAVTDLVLVLVIPVLFFILIRDRQTNRSEYADWTSGDRKIMRTCRAVMWIGVAVVWAVVLVTILHRPALIHEPMLVNIMFMPLILALVALYWSIPEVLKNLHRGRSFRILIFGGMVVVAFGLVASLLALFNAWTARL